MTEETRNIASPRLFGRGKKLLAGWIALFCFHNVNNIIHAQVPTVSYSVTGQSGAWTLDFTLNNNLDQSLYPGEDLILEDLAVGVLGPAVGNLPGNFTVFAQDGSGPGGYDLWTAGTLGPGQSLSGFDLLYAGATAPTSVDWGSQTTVSDDAYTGPGAVPFIFNPPGNVVSVSFSGTAFPAAVPESSTLCLMGLGLALAAMSRKQFKRI